MAELTQISVTGGIPSGGTGDVPTLAPVRDAILEVRDKMIASPATQATLASILAKIISSPATEAKQDAAIAATATIGTRAYGTVQRIDVASATALSTPIAATEVLLHASVKQYVLAVSGTGTPTVSASTGIPLEAGEKFHMRITSGQRIATIREDTDGFLHIAPVT